MSQEEIQAELINKILAPLESSAKECFNAFKIMFSGLYIITALFISVIVVLSILFLTYFISEKRLLKYGKDGLVDLVISLFQSCVTVFLTIGAITVMTVYFAVTSYVRVSINNLKIVDKEYTSPTAKHSLKYVKQGYPIIVKDPEVTKAIGRDCVSCNPDDVSEFGLNYIPTNDSQSVTIVVHKAKFPKAFISLLTTYSKEGMLGSIDPHVIYLLSNHTYVKSITYSDAPDAIQTHYTKTFTPVLPLYDDMVFDNRTVVTKEGSTVDLTDSDVILDNTCKIVLDYKYTGIYSAGEEYNRNIMRVGPYFFTSSHPVIHAIPRELKQETNVGVNVNVK